MSENKETEQEYVDITLFGDKENCSKCDDGDKDLTEKTKNSKKIKYHYVNIYSEPGQEYLRKKGVKEGDNVDIPYIQTCKVEADPNNPDKKSKRCADTNEYKSDTWKSLENDELPSDLKFESTDEQQ